MTLTVVIVVYAAIHYGGCALARGGCQISTDESCYVYRWPLKDLGGTSLFCVASLLGFVKESNERESCRSKIMQDWLYNTTSCVRRWASYLRASKVPSMKGALSDRAPQ